MSILLPLLALITTVSDLREKVAAGSSSDGLPFAVTCTVISARSGPSIHGDIHTGYYVQDESGTCPMTCTNGTPAAPVGCLAVFRGHLGLEPYGWRRAFVDAVNVLASGEQPRPVDTSADRLRDVRWDGRLARIKGILANIAGDEIDPRFSLLKMRSDAGPFVIAILNNELRQLPAVRPGAVIASSGIVVAAPNGGKRQYHTPYLKVKRAEDIAVVQPAPEDPFDVPEADSLQYISAPVISCLNRRAASGRVLATLRGRRLLLKTANGKLVLARFDAGDMPTCGEHVVVTGFPQTDLFSIHLIHALWKRSSAQVPSAECAVPVTPHDILSGPYGEKQLLPEYYGRLISMRGRLTEAAESEHSDRLQLVSDSHTFPLDFTALGNNAPLPPAGSEVELTGVCILNTSSWTPTDIYPQINGFTLAPRSDADIRIFARPPWWTPERLLTALCTLFAAFIGILVWNRFLQHLAELRGRQLFKAEIAQAKADLRVEDRTRLAADIHDSIAQTLTGVGFQIDAAAKTLGDDDRTACADFLAVAKRTLLSCREELRRCIWDLRSRSLEEPDLSTAIRETIRPVVGATAVTVRFNVPRARLSDTTTHALLCIVRELAANAVRHGLARRIRIAGEFKDEHVRFSVTDDGCGFDPENRVGPPQGHFGLQGVRERLSKLGGGLAIESTPGKGAHIIVEIGK